MLDVHDVLRAAGQGCVYVEWVDEDGLVVGFASVQELTPDSVSFFYRFYGTRNVEQGIGHLKLAIVRSKGGTYWDKPSFVCPRSGRKIVRLFYMRGDWASKDSHDLLGITQRLDQVNKAVYIKQEHERRLKEGNIVRVAVRKDEKRKEKYGKSVSLLAGSARTELPWHLQFRTFGRWLAAGETPSEVNTDDVGYGWMPGMTGQIPGLYPTADQLEGEVHQWFAPAPPLPTHVARARPISSQNARDSRAPEPRADATTDRGPQPPPIVIPSIEDMMSGFDIFAPLKVDIPGFE